MVSNPLLPPIAVLVAIAVALIVIAVIATFLAVQRSRKRGGDSEPPAPSAPHEG